MNITHSFNFSKLGEEGNRAQSYCQTLFRNEAMAECWQQFFQQCRVGDEFVLPGEPLAGVVARREWRIGNGTMNLTVWIYKYLPDLNPEQDDENDS